MPESVSPITVALSVRPIRSVILVPEVERIPWQSLFRFACQCHTATWRGSGNLILPVPKGYGSENRLFWDLVDLFDADTFHGLPVRVGDVETLAPDYYRARFAERKAELIDAVPKELESKVAQELAHEPVVGMDLDEGLEDLLRRRVAPLVTATGLPGFRYDAADPPPWPLTSAERLRPLPSELVLMEEWPNDAVALINASTNGEMSPRLVETLRRLDVTVIPFTVPPSSAWSEAITPRQDAPLLALSGLGVGKHSTQASSRRDSSFASVTLLGTSHSRARSTGLESTHVGSRPRHSMT